MNLSGNPIDYLVVFSGGILLSFSPCTYPLIPVSLGYIGVNASGSRLRGFSLSLIYVTGLAVTYSVLGLLASLTGQFFGQLSTHPLTRLIVGLIITIFGLSMLGNLFIKLPQLKLMGLTKKDGYPAVFFLGLSSGLIISPCITPVLGSILAYIATKHNLFYGVTLLFTFAFGMGIIFILSGTFASFLASLPKSGKWMEYIRTIFGLVIASIGLFIIINALRRIII
ncbi:MAG: hypothetical protein C4533_05700 [Candidatus Omnitrophota bacterium]|jgi:thiol:disulfide interchange protein DsbD|nr:MAG: hypothetical protein C4533_05700 [Candidatus Omnitrophota bacterium]